MVVTSVVRIWEKSQVSAFFSYNGSRVQVSCPSFHQLRVFLETMNSTVDLFIVTFIARFLKQDTLKFPAHKK